MHALYLFLLAVHVAAGFAGLVAFWFPVFSQKGGTLHVRMGRIFQYCAYVVAATALTIALLTLASPFGTHPEARPDNPALIPAALAELRFVEAFLGYLAIITFATVYHGVRVMQTKRTPESLRTGFHTALACLAIASSLGILVLALVFDNDARWVLLALSPIGFVIGTGMLRYARRPKARMDHWYEHLGSMMGGGIAFHTAFAVFGIQRFIDYSLAGFVGLLPWIAPSIVGTVAIAFLQRHYRRQFGDLPPRKAAAPR